MSGYPNGGQGPFEQQPWQHAEPMVATAQVAQLAQAQTEAQQKGLSRVGVLVLSIALGIMAIAGILFAMIWLWGSGAMLGLFEDPALVSYLDTLN